MSEIAQPGSSAPPARAESSKLLTAVVVLLVVVAILQLALLLQRHLSRPSSLNSGIPAREVSWSPDDEMAAMQARINQMFAQAISPSFSSQPPAAAAPTPTAGGSAVSSSEDPWLMMRLMQQRIDALFASTANLHHHEPAGFDNGWTRLEITPGFSVQDQGDSYVVRVQLPGVDKSSIHIKMEDSVLGLLVDQSDQESGVDRRGMRQQSQRSLHFERQLRLPGATSRQELVQATFEKGLLRITVPRETQPDKPAQSIPIQ